MASDAEVLTRLTALEVSQAHFKDTLDRMASSTLPGLESTGKALTAELQSQRESRIRMEERNTYMTETLDNINQTLKAAPWSTEIAVVQDELKTVIEKQDAQEKWLSNIKAKASVVGIIVVAIVTLGFNIVSEKVKKWAGL